MVRYYIYIAQPPVEQKLEKMYNYGKLFASNPTLNFYEIFGTNGWSSEGKE